MRQAVEGISDLITTPGIINIDFADVRAVMENAGSALMGVGSASGDNRAVEAARQAINSPLLDVSIAGAKGVLFSIAGGEDLTMFEIQDAAKVITESIDPEAKIIFGTVRDDKLKKNEIKITVIATGFPEGVAASVGKSSQSSGTAMSGGANAGTGTAESNIASLMRRGGTADKGKIYNPSPIAEKSDSSAKKDVKLDIKPDVKPETKEDDDWGAIPAFLRRSRLK